MCLLRISQQHQLLHVWTGRLYNPVSVIGAGSLFAFYHDDSGINTVLRKRGKVFTHSSDQNKTHLSGGGQHQHRSAPRKSQKSENQKQTQRRRDEWRVSPELKKLGLEDLPAEWERPARHKSTQDSRADKYEIVFGIAPCLLALTQGRRKAGKLFVKDGEASHRLSILKVCEEAHQRGVLVQRASKGDLDRMSSGRVHQGVCLQASPLSYLSEDSALSTKGNPMPLWLVLDGVQDPMNLGAILRSAYFLGVERVASSLQYSCPLSPVVSKASAGIMEVFGVYGYENLEDMIKLKVANGWQVVGTVGAEAQDSQIPVTQCSDFQITKPTLLLIGGEGEGLSKTLRSLCRTLLTIPAGRELSPGVESLNVSVAAGILLHSLLFSRRPTRR